MCLRTIAKGPSRSSDGGNRGDEAIVLLLKLSHPYWAELMSGDRRRGSNGKCSVGVANERVESLDEGQDTAALRIAACISSMYRLTKGSATSGLTVLAEARKTTLPVINMSISAFQKVKVRRIDHHRTPLRPLRVVFVTDHFSGTLLEHSPLFKDFDNDTKHTDTRVKIEVYNSTAELKDLGHLPSIDTGAQVEHDKWVSDVGLMERLQKDRITKALQWFPHGGRRFLKEFSTLADNLTALGMQRRTLHRKYQLLRVQLDPIETLLESVSPEVALDLRTELVTFIDLYNNISETMVDTEECYCLLDKSHEYAVNTMKMVVSLRMQRSLTDLELEGIRKRLKIFTDSNPRVSQTTLIRMTSLAARLSTRSRTLLPNCDKLKHRCSSTRNKCEEALRQLSDIDLQIRRQLHFPVTSSPCSSSTSSSSSLCHLTAACDPVLETSLPLSTTSGEEDTPPSRYVTQPSYDDVISRGAGLKRGEPVATSVCRERVLRTDITRTQSAPVGFITCDTTCPLDTPTLIVNGTPLLDDLYDHNVTSKSDDISTCQSCGRATPDDVTCAHTGSNDSFNTASEGTGSDTDIMLTTTLYTTPPREHVTGNNLLRNRLHSHDSLVVNSASCNSLPSSHRSPRRCHRHISPTSDLSLTSPDLSLNVSADCRRPWSPLVPVNSHLLASDAAVTSSMSYIPQHKGTAIRSIDRIIHELLQTEIDYIRSLQFISDQYSHEIETSAHVPESLRGKNAIIFGNLEQIRVFHEQNFLAELRRCIAVNPYHVAHCFLKYEADFHLYSLYNKNKPKADALMAEVGSSFFRIKQREMDEKLDLSSFLLKPTQRVVKYSMLLRQLLKECGTSRAEYKDLKMALDMTNFHLRHGDDLLAMDCITGHDVNLQEQGMLIRRGEFSLIRPSYRLPLTAKGQRTCRHIFLFEKMVILTKTRRHETGPDTYQYKSCIKTSELGLTERVQNNNLQFDLWFRKRHSGESYRLEARDADQKHTVIQDVSQLLWSQAINNRGKHLSHMAEMGIGRKPCVNIKSSCDNINDRFIDVSKTRIRNSISSFERLTLDTSKTSIDYASSPVSPINTPLYNCYSLERPRSIISNVESLGSSSGYSSLKGGVTLSSTYRPAYLDLNDSLLTQNLFPNCMSQPPMMKSLGRSRTMDALLEDTMTSDLQSSVALSYATVSQV